MPSNKGHQPLTLRAGIALALGVAGTNAGLGLAYVEAISRSFAREEARLVVREMVPTRQEWVKLMERIASLETRLDPDGVGG